MRNLFRRTPAARLASCFYCSNVLEPQPPDPRNFVCPACTCRNRYDAQGRVIGDEAAMYQEELNHGAYALRGSPSKTSFPTAIQHVDLFCHTCRMNQTLQINLKRSYLPPPSDPSYQQLVDDYPRYKESLDIRYPLICSSCAPAVEQAVEEKNRMAHTAVLGNALRRTRQQARERQQKAAEESRLSPSARFMRSTLPRVVWALRGCMWGITLLCSLLFHWNASQFLSAYHEPFRIRNPLIILCLTLVSRFWVDWDPRGQETSSEEVKLRYRWKDYQRNLWTLRMLEAVHLLYLEGTTHETLSRVFFAMELILLALSFLSLRSIKRPKLRRIPLNHKSHHNEARPLTDSASSPQSPVDFDPLSTLSLSSEPFPFGRSSSLPAPNIRPPTHTEPKFGQSSLSNNVYTQALFGPSSNPDDEMEWDPLPAARQRDVYEHLRPQRFFPREEPTGLEILLANYRLDDDVPPPSMHPPSRKGISGRMLSWFGLRGRT